MIGVYGVNQDAAELSHYKIDSVFLPPNEKLIRDQAAAGRKVFLTLNVFGGSRAWKMFPDSRPVKADGTFLEASLGGVCPTHEGWRKNRLDELASRLEKFGGPAGIDGVWLDFIRYPGLWEHDPPDIPDTCYCGRCLAKFQADTGIHIGKEAVTVPEKARWIHENAWMQWMAWKKEQVVSFARDARQLIRRYSERHKILLGAFLVPWRKSDYDGAISFRLGQDAGLLAPYVDVFSPMVYHRMVGKPVSWVGEISGYFADQSDRTVWPIVQAEKVGAKEFSHVVQRVSWSGAQGILVYKFKDIKKEQWPVLATFKARENLLQNPQLRVSGEKKAGNRSVPEEGILPDHWHTAPADKVVDSRFRVQINDGGNAVGLSAGYDRQAFWATELPVCRPGTSYLFSADFLRKDLRDGAAYPEVSLWGRTYKLNTHRIAGKFQRLKTVVTCPKGSSDTSRVFQFRNNAPGNTLWMRAPKLVVREPAALESTPRMPPKSDFFPIGTYGANAKNLEALKKLGLNTAVISLTRENVEACLAHTMRCTLAVPRSPEQLIHLLNTLEPLLKKGRFSYYVNDEPELHSFPEKTAEDIERIIKQHFPQAVTGMAVLRSQAVHFYEKSADYFMLDQYPVPYMPFTWLSESMDDAAGQVGRGRLQSVIQAFGGKKYAVDGWPRLPTFAEMNCLAMLSIIHGSRGIYFYTFPSITSTVQGRRDFERVVRRLNGMRSWLEVVNSSRNVGVRMVSKSRVDPRGNPAVHCALKEQRNTRMLLCANVLPTYTAAEISVSPERGKTWLNYFGHEKLLVVDQKITAQFDPYEVKALMESR